MRLACRAGHMFEYTEGPGSNDDQTTLTLRRKTVRFGHTREACHVNHTDTLYRNGIDPRRPVGTSNRQHVQQRCSVPLSTRAFLRGDGTRVTKFRSEKPPLVIDRQVGRA
ncbi:hypothetical protein BaRGS_00029816 [Batillaria attramentaria]|uniref:Uncharacterized protein n=1 Tax=Batillaria attramentaria TaxID=370345 RepID=A0ABD0JW47_9CAEN